MLDTRVLALRVLPNQDSVDIFVRGFEALDGNARADIGEEVKSPAKGKI